MQQGFTSHMLATNTIKQSCMLSEFYFGMPSQKYIRLMS